MGKKKIPRRWYAVAVGRKQGVFHGWNEGQCAEDQVKGFAGQVFKGFDSEEEAKAWLTAQMEKMNTQEGEKGKEKRPREPTTPPQTVQTTPKEE